MNKNLEASEVPNTWPYYSREQIEAVAAVLQSGKVNYWTGNEGKQFEKEFADYLGCQYAIALANGTLALELALRALEIGEGDEVIVPCRTFIATASAAIAVGARPIVVDVEKESQNLSVSTLAKAVTKKTKAIIVVHLAGYPCDMDNINSFAKENNLKVIEDCAQAHGAVYKGRKVGSLGDISAFSFCQDKIITTGGEGGLVATNSQELWNKMWAYKDHGKDYNKVIAKDHPPGFRWLHENFGSNYRMTEMQAVIGRIQLKKLESWVEIRNQHANKIFNAVENIPGLIIFKPENEIRHAYYRCYVGVDSSKLSAGWNRDKIMVEINRRGISCSIGSCPEIYLESAFKKNNLAPVERFPNAQWLGENSLAFLVHPTLTAVDTDKMIQVITEVMEMAAPVTVAS